MNEKRSKALKSPSTSTTRPSKNTKNEGTFGTLPTQLALPKHETPAVTQEKLVSVSPVEAQSQSMGPYMQDLMIFNDQDIFAIENEGKSCISPVFSCATMVLLKNLYQNATVTGNNIQALLSSSTIIDTTNDTMPLSIKPISGVDIFREELEHKEAGKIFLHQPGYHNKNLLYLHTSPLSSCSTRACSFSRKYGSRTSRTSRPAHKKHA